MAWGVSELSRGCFGHPAGSLHFVKGGAEVVVELPTAIALPSAMTAQKLRDPCGHRRGEKHAEAVRGKQPLADAGDNVEGD